MLAVVAPLDAKSTFYAGEGLGRILMDVQARTVTRLALGDNDGETGRSRNWPVAVDIAGQVATAKVIDRYLGKRFTDYLSLVKGDKGWRIYNKLWHADPI